VGILLILAQIALAILVYGAHVLALSPWLTFLPAILLGAIYLIGRLFGATFVIDGFKNIYAVDRRRR
jgi:hypothetical protein